MTHSPAIGNRSIKQANSAAVSTDHHALGTTAKLSRRHAQASRAQQSVRPVHASTVFGSQSESQPKVK